MRRPAGFDAGPLLQLSVILCQFRVTLCRQPRGQKVGSYLNCNIKSHIYWPVSRQNNKSVLSRLPKSESIGNSWKNGHICQWEVWSCQVGALKERGEKHNMFKCVTTCWVCMWAQFIQGYLLQVTLPQFEFSSQSLLVPLHSGVMPLSFRYVPLIVNNST